MWKVRGSSIVALNSEKSTKLENKMIRKAIQFTKMPSNCSLLFKICFFPKEWNLVTDLYIYPLHPFISAQPKPSLSLSLSLPKHTAFDQGISFTVQKPCLRNQRTHWNPQITALVRVTREHFSSLKMLLQTLMRSRRKSLKKSSLSMLTLSTCKGMVLMATSIVTVSRNSCLSSPMRISNLISIVLPMGIPPQSFALNPFQSSWQGVCVRVWEFSHWNH